MLVSAMRWRLGCSRWRFARGVCFGALFAALLVGLCAAGASASIVGRPSWQPPVLVDPSGELAAIACPSASLCVAADRSGNVITSTDPSGGAAAWREAHVDGNQDCAPSACAFQAISCPSASFCAAVDNAGYVFTSTNPTAGVAGWSSVKISTPDTLTALSCPSISLCVAVDYHGNAITSTSPTAGADTWHTATIDSGPCPTAVCHSIDAGPPERQLDAISCPSVSLCVAGDWDGDVVTSMNPTGGSSAWSAAYVDSNSEGAPTFVAIQAAIANVSCPSVSLCLASDGTGGVVTSQDPAGGASVWKLTRAAPYTGGPGGGGFDSLSCPSASFCAALYEVGWASPTEIDLTYNPLSGAQWSPVSVDRLADLRAVSCPSELLCVGVEKAGSVVVGRAKLLTQAQIQALLRTQITPRGEASLIGAVLRHGAFALAFNPPAPGGVRLRWLLLPAGTNSPSSRAHVLVIARGQRNFPEGQSAPITLKLTKAGIAVLRRRNHVRLTAEALFTPPGDRSATATETFTLGR